MNCTTNFLPYQRTGYFSAIAIDYLQQHKQLQPFYNYEVSVDGIKKSIESRKAFSTNRKLLVDELRKQYTGISLSAKQEQHLQSLLSENTFTITTAHQPNIFTGPLFFIYKIFHAIKLADELADELTDYKFVPVYYMGSEDADLDELGFINLDSNKIMWNTKQTGAVGRMKVDKAFIKLIDLIHGQVGVHSYGKELTDLFKQFYAEGKTIQQATLELVNHLFADFGLLILIPDNAALKRSFQSVFEKELTDEFSHKAVVQTINELRKSYKIQTSGRELNLFYSIDDKKERIEVTSNKLQDSSYKFQVPGLKKEWSKDEILTELNDYPERFSANVILRGVFQETILPNIAFVGGGGELAYWLELKKVFEAVNVPYPMLILRNSFLWMNKKQLERLNKLGFHINDLFKKQEELLNEWVRKNSAKQLSITGEVEKIDSLYQQLQTISENVDITLSQHTKALQAKSLKQLKGLEKKIFRAEKRNFETQKQQIEKLKHELFPANSLQERSENFSLLYAQFGKEWLQTIYNSSKGLAQEFCVIVAE
ncbi:MAG: bacillithiol biosynthesis cysteine-adding enzyme BshC [Bacteroidota bacterium]|nr:bacillithiol biosynthesis cysteine-adding enzyme BshC [Bacteroidota bacterium]